MEGANGVTLGMMNDDAPMFSIGQTTIFGWRTWLVAGVLLGTGCEKKTDPLARFEFEEPHMGTLFRIVLYAPDQVRANDAASAAFARVEELNGILSDYDPESEVSRLCREPANTAVKVSSDLFHVLNKACEVAEQSSGAFDPTMGNYVLHWRRAHRRRELPDQARLEALREKSGYQLVECDASASTVTLKTEGVRLDFGGIGKGYAADEALKVLAGHDITRALVAASGDIALGDPPPGEHGWNVGVASFDPTGADLTSRLVLRNAAVSTSGDSQQWEMIGGVRYSHIVDPRTGLGLTERLAVSVVAKKAVETDAWATALSVLGRTGQSVAGANPDIEVMWVWADGEMEKTDGFP